MSLSANLNGSINHAGSVNNSQSYSQSNSQTFGNAASAQALSNMREANAYNEAMWEKAAAFNAEQARIQREWQEHMSSTTYQRTVKDMIAAGINPILAAGAGLGADTIGSGATASMSSSSASMAGAYPDSISSSYGASQSHGSSWSEGESGLAVGLQMLGEAIAGVINSRNTASTVINLGSYMSGKAEDTYNDFINFMIKEHPTVANMLGLSYDATSNSASKTNAPTRKKTVTGSGKVGSTKPLNDGKGYLKGGIYGLLEK